MWSKEPFLTRCGIRCRRLSRRALFHIQVWGIIPLERVNCNGLLSCFQCPLRPLFHAERKGHFQGQNRPKPASLYQRIESPCWDPEFEHLCVLLSRNDLEVHRIIRESETICQFMRTITERKIDEIINKSHRRENPDKILNEAYGTMAKKKPSIQKRLDGTKWECAKRKASDKPTP